MKDVRIRRGGLDDLDAIMPIMKVAFEDRYGEGWTIHQCRSMIQTMGSALYLAEAPRTCGFAITRLVVDECELLLLAVEPHYQRFGIGKRLLAHVKSDSMKDGAKRLFLEVRANNAALQFYADNGLKKIGSRPRYYRGPSGALFDAETLSSLLS